MNVALKHRIKYFATHSSWRHLAVSLQRLRTQPEELQAVSDRCKLNPPIIIIGAGPAAQECARQMAAMSGDDWLLVINGEDYLPYHRAQLSSVLASGSEVETLVASNFSEQIHMLHGVNIEAVDAQEKTIGTGNAIQFKYRKLVFATGSRSRRPSLQGLTGPRVFDFRQLQDLEQIAALAPRRVAVLGGGLLGIEAARALQKFCEQVTVFEYYPHLLPRQMDLGSGKRLAAHLLTLGIQVQVNARLVTADSSGSQIRLSDETRNAWNVDAVVCATGISANIELAQQAGLDCHRGILVDDNQHTSSTDIYAIGECCERDGQVAGNLSTSLDHARRAAAAIFEKPLPQQGFAEVFQLKIGSCVAVAIGKARPSDTSAIAYAPNAHSYYRVIVEEQRVVGAILIGDARLDFSPFTAAVEQRIAWTELVEKCFLQTGKLPRIDLHSADTVTCFCTGVTFGQLCKLRDAGLSHDSIVAQTGASQHCGSCTQRVAHITAGTGEVLQKASTPTGLWTATLLSLVLVAAACTALVIPMADSWQSPWRTLDSLWRNNLIRQISGYSLLSLIALAFWPAWQRRAQRERKRRQSMSLLSWHMIVGCVVLAGYVVHTGARLGHGLNSNLSLVFMMTIALGAVSSVAWRQAAHGDRQRAIAQRIRSLHWASLLPIPALLIVHIIKSYYF